MVIKDIAAAGGSQSRASEKHLEQTPNLQQVIEACDRDEKKHVDEKEAVNCAASHLSGTEFGVKLEHKHMAKSSFDSQFGTNHSRERGCPQCLSATKKSATSLVREESCFRMIELTEALAIVDGEIRSAVQLQLRNLPLSRASPVTSSGCREGDSSQAVQPQGSRIEHVGFPGRKCLEKKASSLRYADTEEQGGKDRGRRCLGVNYVHSEDCLIETVAPPFVGRRVGAPEGVTAPFALPPFRASLVDGYALHIPAGRWGEIQELYRMSCLGQKVQLDAEHTVDNRVALKIAGEVRAGANVAEGTVEPFRGHPHILSEWRGAGSGDSRGQCCLNNRTHKATERAYEVHDAAAPTALQCVYVTTGAPVPKWCNAVVPVESCEVDVDDCLCWPDQEVVSKFAGMGENIRDIGSDAPAKSLLLQQGQLIGPAEEGVLAAVGLEKLDVFRKLNVHTLALGDELRSRVAARTLQTRGSRGDAPQSESETCLRHVVQDSPGCAINQDDGEFHSPTQEPICFTRADQTTKSAATDAVYDSNSPMLKALLLQHCPSTSVGRQHVLPDSVDEVRRLLLALALKEHSMPRRLAREAQIGNQPVCGSHRVHQDRSVDVVVSTGGVSMGGSDCMKLALLQLQKNSFEQHQCGQINTGDRERFVRPEEQNRSDGPKMQGGTPCGKSATSLSKDSEDAADGHEVAVAGKTNTSLPDTGPCVTQDCFTVETEVKFGRLNVKPGKPAIFAVLRVFRHSTATTTTLESHDMQMQQPVPHGELHECTVTGQQKNENGTASNSARTPTGINHFPCGRLVGTSLTSSAEKRPSSSITKAYHRHPARSPVRTLLVFALPGNPCSAWVLFHLLVAPALNFYSCFCPSASLSNHVPAQILATLDEPVMADIVRPEYHRALVYVEHSNDKARPWDYNGCPHAQEAQSSANGWTLADQATLHLRAFPTGRQASSRLLSCCASANGLILVAPRKISKSSGINASETVRVLLCGTPFPIRPDPLIRLLRLQNKLTGFHEAKCRCGGNKEGADEASTTNRGKKQTKSITERISHTDGSAEVTPSCSAASARSLFDAGAVLDSHFSYKRPLSEAVKLGVVIVSDRCFLGNMQDACAETLLNVLRSSSAVAALLQLSSQREPSTSLVQGRVSATVVTDGNLPSEGYTWDRHRQQGERVVIVPDAVESIRDAVFSMLCACGGYPKKLLVPNRSPPRRSVIFVCGGTGLAIRDVTPQALLPLFTVRCNGIEHLLLEHSLRCTPLAALGRPCAGVIECQAGRQVTEGNESSSGVSVGMCQSATEIGACSRAHIMTCSLPKKYCSCTGPSAPKAPQGSECVVTDECCPRDAVKNVVNCEDVTPCQEVPCRSKDALAGQGNPGSTPGLPDSGTAGALKRVDPDKRKVSGEPSGCGARCMVLVFPGSPKAVRELAEALLPVLPHALEQLSK